MGTANAERLRDAAWLAVDDGEEIRWAGRPSRYTIAVSLALALALAAAGLAFTYRLYPLVAAQQLPLGGGHHLPAWLGVAPLVLTLYGVVAGALTYLEWRRHLYVITDDCVYVRYGLVSREITQVPLARVQNASFDQSVLQRVLSYGDVHVFTAGSDTEDLTFDRVPNPQEVSEALLGTRTERRDRDPEPLGAV